MMVRLCHSSRLFSNPSPLAAGSRVVLLTALLCFPRPELALADEPAASTGAEASTSESAPTLIRLTPASHFTGADGADIRIPAGTYRLERSGPELMRLSAEGDASPLIVQAVEASHDFDIVEPVAFWASVEGYEDEQHLLLLLPDGTALEAIGSYSGTRSRGSSFSALSRLALRPSPAPGKIVPGLRPPSPHTLGKRRAPKPVPAPAPAAPPPAAAGEQEDTGWATIPADETGPVTWGYLRMHAPETVVNMIQAAQAGQIPAGLLHGLASPDQLRALLSTKLAVRSQAIESGIPDAAGGIAAPAPRGLGDKPFVPAPRSGERLSRQAVEPGPAGQANPPGSVSSLADARLRGDWATVVQQSRPGIRDRLDRDAVEMIIPTNDFTPQVLALGSAWEGQTRRASVRITAARDGPVTAALPPNTPFRIVKIATATGVLQRAVSAVASLGGQAVTRQEGEAATKAPFTISARSGQDIVATVEFAPVFAPFGTRGTAVGNHQATLEISGRKWFANVPVSARFEGIKLGVIPLLEQSEVTIINTAVYDMNRCGYDIPQTLTLMNAEQQPRTVTVAPENLPDPFSFIPITVQMGPGETKKIPLAIRLHCISDYPFARGFDLAFKIAYPGQERRVSFSVDVYPPIYKATRKGELGSCDYHIELYILPNGYRDLFAAVFNNNLVFGRSFDLAVYFAGGKIGEAHLQPPGNASRSLRYGMKLQPLADRYTTLFGEVPNFQMRCFSRGPL